MMAAAVPLGSCTYWSVLAPANCRQTDAMVIVCTPENARTSSMTHPAQKLKQQTKSTDILLGKQQSPAEN
jgi:hypothetical protein